MRTHHSPAVAFRLSPITLCPVMVCPRNRVGRVKIAGMDSQGIGNLFAGVSALGAIVSAILAYITWRQALGSKEAKAKADEAHKAALDMRDAAQRSAEVAQEKVKQAERSAKAAEEQVKQAEELLEQMSDIASNLWRPEFELTNVPRTSIFNLRNVTMGPIKILEVVNLSQFIDKKNIKETVEKEFGSGEMVRITLDYYGDDNNLRLRIDGRDNILCVPIEYNRKS